MLPLTFGLLFTGMACSYAGQSFSGWQMTIIHREYRFFPCQYRLYC